MTYKVDVLCICHQKPQPVERKEFGSVQDVLHFFDTFGQQSTADCPDHKRLFTIPQLVPSVSR